MATSEPLSLSQLDAQHIEMSNLQDQSTNETLLTNNNTGDASAIPENTNGPIPEDNSAKDTKTCCFRFCSTTPTEKFKFTKVDLFFLVVSLVTYIADIGSDIWVAVFHYKNGDIWWMALTLVFVIAPCAIVGLWSLPLVCSADCNDIKLFLSVAVPGGLSYIFAADIHVGWEMMRKKDPEQKQALADKLIEKLRDSHWFRLFEAFLEAAPQLVLQLYIMFSNHAKSDHLIVAVQWGSVCISLASLSWAMTSFYKTNRLHDKKYKVPLPGVLLVFLFHVFTIGARVLSLALFAAYSGYAVLALAGIHYIIMLIWSLLMRNSNLCYIGCDDFVASAYAAFISIFCFWFGGQYKRLRLAFFYTLMYIEIVVMLLAWYFTTQPMYEWYRYLTCVVIIGGFFIGILCLVVYYVDLHPKNFVENPKKHIQIWVPFSKLTLIRKREECEEGCVCCIG